MSGWDLSVLKKAILGLSIVRKLVSIFLYFELNLGGWLPASLYYLPKLSRNSFFFKRVSLSST